MIFILSMHRSGSSLLTGLLKDNGFIVGDESSLIPSSDANKKGFMERRDIVDFNEAMLTANGHSHLAPNLDFVVDQKFSEGGFRKIIDKLKKQKVNLIKDPRMCLTLPKWLPHFENNAVIYLTRNPVDVAQSLERRQGYPFHSGLALWEFYNYQALKNIHGLPVKHINFDSLINSPADNVDSIIRWLDDGSLNISKPKNRGIANTSYYESSLHARPHGMLDKQIASNSQTRLYNYLLNPETDYTGPYITEGVTNSMKILEQFISIGYKPGSGRIIDPKSEKQLEEAIAKEAECRKAFKDLKLHSNNLSITLARFLGSRSGLVLLKYQAIRTRMARDDKVGILDNLRELNNKLPR